jgi:pyroglutamyl-peptidase
MRIVLSALFTLTIAAGHALAAEPLTEPVVLLTGFEPFGGASVNASWEAVRGLQGQTIAGHRVETLQLPVVYDAVRAPLRAAIAKWKPAAVLCFGEGTPVVQVETVARNGYHPQRPLDNNKQPPPREKIAPGGLPLFGTRLPADALLAALQEMKVAARKSTDAGGYLCNECFYEVMASPASPALRGFVHLPVLGTKDPQSGAEATAESLRAVVKRLAEVTLTARAAGN